MTPEQEALVRKAQDSLRGAQVLASQKLFDFAVSRAYYTMFYVAEAFLLGEGLTFSKHSGVIAAFGQHANAHFWKGQTNGEVSKPAAAAPRVLSLSKAFEIAEEERRRQAANRENAKASFIEQPEPQRSSYRSLSAVAAGFVLVVLVLSFLDRSGSNSTSIPNIEEHPTDQTQGQATRALQAVPSGSPFILKLEAATGDTWVKYQVDDSKPTTLVLKQGQTQDLPPAQDKITLNYGSRLTLKLKINNREANFPPDTPKFASQVVISRDNLETFLR